MDGSFKQELAVLVVDDNESFSQSVCLNLASAGYSCTSATSADQALEVLDGRVFDIILCDHQMPGMDGIEFIKKCRTTLPEVAVVLMTAFGSSDLAITAMRAGAYDYIAKPFEPEELILTLKKIEERERLKIENIKLKEEISGQYNFSNIVAHSKSMLDIFETVQRLSQFNTTVLVRGESGTGKELLARAIHHNSPRRQERFVAINCGAIPENLMESELFGHKKGAFTDATRDKPGLFTEASGGTIFLDEIGELPLHLQVKLLRVLQEQQVQPVGSEEVIDIDVRVIAATLKDLEADAKEGKFRDDLFYRLNVVSLEIPPLRDRSEDIPILVDHFIEKISKKLSLDSRTISPEALKCLLNYEWRGNVRELENCIERALVLATSSEIRVDALPEHIQTAGETLGGGRTEPDSLSIKRKTRDLEVDLITLALHKTSANRTRAAKLLEISHRALLYKIKEYGLENVGK